MRRVAILLLAVMPLAAQAQDRGASGARVEVTGTAPAPLPAPRPPRAGPEARPDIEVAYRAFASGDLDSADRLLTLLIERRPSPAAFLLRGCTRYTKARLARRGAELTELARQDIRRAFALNQSLWLDPKAFSPRLIDFVDEVRRGM